MDETRRGLLQAIVAVPGGLVAARALPAAGGRPAGDDLGPNVPGRNDATPNRPWRSSAGSFHCWGYCGTVGDRVVQMICECTNTTSGPKNIVCSVPVYASFRNAIIRSAETVLQDMSVEMWCELHGAPELRVMGAEVVWSREIPEDQMWFFDRLNPRLTPMPSIATGRLVGGPPGLLGVITGWTA